MPWKMKEPVPPRVGDSRACWLVYRLKYRMWKAGWWQWSVEELRDAFPFDRGVNGPDFEKPEIGDVGDAVKAAQRHRSYFNGEYQLRLHDRADWTGVDYNLRLFSWRFLRALRARGLPFYVHTAYRSPEEQLKAFEQGFSGLKSGPHQRGAAVDIVSSAEHWNIPKELWEYVGTLGEAVARDTNFPAGVKIEWGGRWQGLYDPAHWQLANWVDKPVVQHDGDALRLSPYSDQMRFG